MTFRGRPGIQPKFEALRNLYEGKKIIVGRDKLDAVTGVTQKVRVSISHGQAILIFSSSSFADFLSY
jgi:hypothetical protein